MGRFFVSFLFKVEDFFLVFFWDGFRFLFGVSGKFLVSVVKIRV